MMSHASEIPLRVAPERSIAEDWELVLIAEGLSPRVWRSREGFVIVVPAEQAERAVAALSAYESENPVEPAEDNDPAAPIHLIPGITVAGALLAFFFVTGELNPEGPWFERGSAEARQILLGELWRTVTALTLHVDIGHTLANGVAIALFLSALGRWTGPGLGAMLVLLAGATGNLANAFFHGFPHVAVGASTAVFGAVGLLCSLGIAWRRRLGWPRRRSWLPLGAGLALLAMLGTSGQRVDLWSHLFGFLAGGLLGFAVVSFVLRPPRLPVQWTVGGAALVVVVACWALALRN